MSRESQKTVDFVLMVGDRGRIVLPSDLRKRMGLKKGDSLHARLDENNILAIEDMKRTVDNFVGLLTPYTNGQPIVDDFIAERRREAMSE